MYITKKIKMEENLVSDTENIVSEERKIEDKIKGFENSIHSQDLLTSELLIKNNKKRVRYGIITIVGLIIQKLEFAVLSSINSLSIYYTAFLSYKDNSIKLENSITLGSLLTFAQFSSIWSGGVLNKFIHIRLIIIIGGILFLLSSLGIIFLESLLGYKFMMVLYGVGIGIQEGITYGNASSFIPEKKGLINGLANVSWTLFCSFFNYIGLHIVNPDGLDVQLYEDNGISKNIIKYTIITIILFAAGTVGTSILTISYKKGDYEYLNNNEQSENNENEEDNILLDYIGNIC
jgi:MFS family permease